MAGSANWKINLDSNIKSMLSDAMNLKKEIQGITKQDYKIDLNIDERKIENLISSLNKMINDLGSGKGDFEQFDLLSREIKNTKNEIESLKGSISQLISDNVSVGNFADKLDDNLRSVQNTVDNLSKGFVELQKILDNVSNKNNISSTSIVDENSLKTIIDLFSKMESSLSSMRKVFADVGDGEEFSPLLKMINNVQSSISELSTGVKSIGLNMNIDIGSDSEMEAKVQSKIANALQAYQRLFDAIKMSGAGGSVINTNFFEFDINQYDTMMGKLQAYKKFIDNMRKEAKVQYNGKDILYQSVDKTYWTQASAAMGQVTKAFNEMKSSANDNPLTDMFGRTDLSEVVSQLGLIVAKLEEISSSASEFKNVFKEGFNVTTSVEEIDKLTNRVKELEDELSKIKLNPVNVDKSNISSENIIESQAKENTQALNDEINSVNSLISAFRTLYETNKKSYKSGESLLVGNFDGSTLSHTGADFSSIETDVIDGTIKAFKDTTNKVVSFLAHTHPGDVAAFSAGDIYNAFFDHINNQIKDYFVIAKKEISWFDTSSLGGIDHAEFLEKFKENKERINQDIQEETQIWSNFSKYLTNIFDGDLYGGLTKLVKDSIDNSIANLGEHKIPEDVLNSLYVGLEEKVRKFVNSINDDDFVSASTVMNTLRKDIGSGLEEYAMSKPPFANGGASRLDSTMWKNLYDELKSVFDTANQQNENIQNGIKQALIETLSSYGINADDVYKSMSFDDFSKAIVDGNLRATQSAREAIEVFKQEAQSVENIGSETPIKDVFQGDKIDQATTSAKELDKTLEQVNIPTDSFDEVLSKLDLTKSELKEIVKITKQSVSDSEGKFHDSYTLKDNRGSTEIYGLSSNTKKGQLLRSNIVGYDAKAESQESKRIIEENIRLNKPYYDSKKQEEAEYQRLRAKYLAEGKAQEEKYYSDLKKSRESTLKSYQDQINSFNNQIPKKPIDGQRSDYFEGFVQKYREAIDEARKYLDTLGDSPITKEVKDEWERLIGVIKKAKEEMDAVPNAARGSDEASRMKEIDKLTKYLDKNTRISKEAREQLEGYLALLKSGDPSVNVKEIHTAWTAVAVAEREAGREGKSFFDILKNKTIYGYAAQLAQYYLSFMDIIRYARNAVNAIRELDTALVDLKKTTTMSASDLERFYYNSNELAKKMGVTTAEIINQASAWSRLGFSTKEASTQMAELSSQFASISPGMDLDSATDGLVSSMKAFGIKVENVERDIMDNINRIGNTAATSNDEIVDMLTRSSAAMSAANNTIQETIALETAAVEITRNAETTGTAFKTKFCLYVQKCAYRKYLIAGNA